MNKHWVGWLALTLLVAVGIAFWMPVQAKEEAVPVASRLLHALEDTGATALEVQVRLRASLDQVKSPEEWKDVAEEWATRLGISTTGAEISEAANLLSYRTKSNTAGVEIRYQVTGVSSNGSYHTYLVLQLSGTPSTLPYIESMQKNYAEALRDASFVTQISTCIRGMDNVKMSVDQQEGRILSIFHALEAEELERLQDNTVVSISGYTRLWDDFIPLNGQKMNLQVATHRNSDAGTWITIGTPIITVEY